MSQKKCESQKDRKSQKVYYDYHIKSQDTQTPIVTVQQTRVISHKITETVVEVTQ